MVAAVIATTSGAASGDLGGWWIGTVIGVVVVLVVAVVVITLIVLARRIEAQALAAVAAIDAATANTDPLWELGTTNRTALAILEGAVRAREAVEGA